MTHRSVLQLSLRYGAILTVSVGVVGATVGFLLDGLPGVLSTVVGAVMAALFMGLTAASILLAERLSRGRSTPGLYFGIIIGAWVGKLVLFAIVGFLLRDQPWVNPYLYFFAVLVVVIGSLVADALAMTRSRVVYVGEVALPGDGGPDRTAPPASRRS